MYRKTYKLHVPEYSMVKCKHCKSENTYFIEAHTTMDEVPCNRAGVNLALGENR